VIRIGAKAMDGNDPVKKSAKRATQMSSVDELKFCIGRVVENFECSRPWFVSASTNLDNDGAE
jgi:hypothetical protein